MPLGTVQDENHPDQVNYPGEKWQVDLTNPQGGYWYLPAANETVIDPFYWDSSHTYIEGVSVVSRNGVLYKYNTAAIKGSAVTNTDPAAGDGSLTSDWPYQSIEHHVDTYAEIATFPLNTSTFLDVGGLRGGPFDWVAGDQSANVTADPLGGIWVPHAADVTGATGVWKRRITDGVVNPLMYGAAGDDVRNDAAELQAAVDSGYAVDLLHDRSYFIEGNLSLQSSDTVFYGQGYKSFLRFNNGALLIDADAVAGNTEHNSMHSFSVRREGTVGPAIHFTGRRPGGDNRGDIRSNYWNIWVRGSTGDGIFLEKTYLQWFSGVWVIDCPNGYGWNFDDVNSVQIYGGETKDCKVGVRISEGRTILINGNAIEGNDDGGVIISGACHIPVIENCHFESNAVALPEGYDVMVGDPLIPAATVLGAKIINNVFECVASAVRNHHIHWVNAAGGRSEGNFFRGHQISMHTGKTATYVVGCITKGDVSANVGFTRHIDAETFRTNIVSIRRDDSYIMERLLDFGNLAAGANQTINLGVTLTVTLGDVTTDARVQVYVIPSAEKDINQDFIIYTGEIIALNTLRLRAYNTTGAAIDPGANRFRIEIFPTV